MYINNKTIQEKGLLVVEVYLHKDLLGHICQYTPDIYLTYINTSPI